MKLTLRLPKGVDRKTGEHMAAALELAFEDVELPAAAAVLIETSGSTGG